MLYTYKYIIANEGVDTAKSYPFYGKVNFDVINTIFVYGTIYIYI